MKNHEIDAPVSVLRRKLMLGLPGGLALSTPLALIGCGGGGSDTAADVPRDADVIDPEIAAIVAKLPAFDRTVVAVAVTLPVGSGVTLASTKLVTANNVSQVAADGTAGAVLLGGAPQMAYLFDAAGRLLLMGIIEPGASTALNSRSTAVALILVASEAAIEGDAIEIAVRETLRTHPVVEPVRLAVEAALAGAGIDDTDTRLTGTIETAVRALRGAPAHAAQAREHALGVEIAPETAQSGVSVERTDDYNTVRLRNSFRRRTHVWVSQVGSYDAGGHFSPLPEPALVKSFGLSATTALSFDNLVIGVGDYVAELAKDIGFLGDYQRGNGWWNPVTSAALALGVEPASAVSVYRARVIGIGTGDGQGVPADDEGARRDEILSATMWEDICLPIIKTFVLPMISTKIGKSYEKDFKSLASSLLLAATVDLTKIEVSGKYFPATVAALRKGDASEMLSQFFKEFFGSGVWKKLLETALKATIRASTNELLPGLRDSTGALIGVNVLDTNRVQAAVDKMSGALSKLGRIITVIKVITTAGDLAAMAKDWSASFEADEFLINVSKATISLSPSPVVVSYLAGTAGKGEVSAKVEGLDGGVTPENVFLQWSCSGRYGNLFKRGGVAGNDTNSFESTLTNPTHDYLPSQLSDDRAAPETIKITAFYRNVTTNQRVEMGSVTVPVQFKKEFNLSITPASGAEVPTDTEFPVNTFFDERLPEGTTVDWAWSHAGVGSLVAVAPDANPKDSSVNFNSPSTEGSAKVTVRATLTVPAGATTPLRTVVTEPISTNLNVKKGLKTITMEVSGGVFGCTDPKACGVSEYTAFVVPRLAKAVSYTAVLSGYAYPSCNRSVTWISVQGDGGGCNFPVTYYPHSSAGATNAWAVWIGFGGAFSGKCVVTITLAP